MQTFFRQTAFATTAILGLSGFGFAAAAAPPAAGNPTVLAPAATASSPATAPAKPAVRQSQESTVEQRIADLHAKLKITAAEQTQWDTFAQAMRDNAMAIDQAFQSRVKALPTMTAADNVKSYAELSAEHAKDMQKLVPTFQALYNTMSDSQKPSPTRCSGTTPIAVHRPSTARRGQMAYRISDGHPASPLRLVLFAGFAAGVLTAVFAAPAYAVNPPAAGGSEARQVPAIYQVAGEIRVDGMGEGARAAATTAAAGSADRPTTPLRRSWLRHMDTTSSPFHCST